MGCGALSKVAFPGDDDDEATTLDGSIYNSSRGSNTNESVDEFDVEQVIPIHSLQEKLWGVKEGAISSQNLYQFMDLLKIDMLEMQKALQTFRGIGSRQEITAMQISRVSSLPVMSGKTNPLLSRFVRAIHTPEEGDKEHLTYREFVFGRRLFEELASHEEILQFWFLVMLASAGKVVELRQEIDKKSLVSFLVDVILSKTESFDSFLSKAPSKLRNKVQLVLNKSNLDRDDYNFHHFQRIVEVSNKSLFMGSILEKVYRKLSGAFQKNEANSKQVKPDMIMTYFWNLKRDIKKSSKGFRGSKRSVWVHPFEGEEVFETGATGIRDITNLPRSRREEAMQVGWKF